MGNELTIDYVVNTLKQDGKGSKQKVVNKLENLTVLEILSLINDLSKKYSSMVDTLKENKTCVKNHVEKTDNFISNVNKYEEYYTYLSEKEQVKELQSLRRDLTEIINILNGGIE